MAAVNPPSYLQTGNHSAIADRKTTSALLMPGSGAASVRSGVRPSNDNAGLQVAANGTPNNTVIVGAGQVVIQGTAGGDAYVCTNDANVTLTIGAASTTQSRIDLIVARVYDQEQNGADPSNSWALEVVTGTLSSGTPSAPATPARSYGLAEVLVSAGASTVITSAKITDKRGNTRLAGLGGIIPVISSATMPSNPYAGMAAFCIDIEELRIWSGSAWDRSPMGALPDPVFGGDASTFTLGADLSLRNFSPRVKVDLTLARPAWCIIRLAAVLRLQATTSAQLYVRLECHNATAFVGAPSPIGTFGNAMSLFVGSSGDRFDVHDSIAVFAKINAGLNTFEAQYETAGAANPRAVIAPCIEVLPVRWA
jgi:hypothetical protein